MDFIADNKRPKIVLTGGGTAGHIMPNLALLPYLKEFDVHYIGRPDSMESSLVSAHGGITFHPLGAVKLKRGFALSNLLIPFKLLAYRHRAKKLLREIAPQIIFSKGGFAALPVMLAAGKIPLILHESDSSIGLANRLAVKRCALVCASFKRVAERYGNGVFTGAPLRQSLYKGDKLRSERECGLAGRKNLLIFGGSSGAKAINDAAFEAMPALVKRCDVTLITGKNESRKTAVPRCFQTGFTSHIEDYFAWADLCVSRGGANALFELAALKIPSLVIPLPKGGSRGDQVENAEYFRARGFCRVLAQEALTAESLIAEIDSLDKFKDALVSAMKNARGIDGAALIADLIKERALR
jgi:UDP-N-acetylglucosamine--N-acetylmuramyl-(pentapeptide) pyrophosphoryl-undecaprenol N-acetylglucosamine transferase